MKRNFRLIFNAFVFIFTIINILFLILFTIDFIFGLKASLLNVLQFDLILSIMITFQILLNLKDKTNKIKYITKNWTEILAIIPLAYLVINLFPEANLLIIILFLIRIITLILYLLRIKDIIRFTTKTNLDYATFILLTTLIFGSILFFWAESSVNPQVNNLDNSFFFIIVTMSTVGYGNIVPFTDFGKLISIIAILVGVGYTGWVTAAIATSLIDKLRKERKKDINRQNEMIEDVLKKLDKIEKELKDIKGEKK